MSVVCPCSLSLKPCEHGAELELITFTGRQDATVPAKLASAVHIASLGSKHSFSLLANYLSIVLPKIPLETGMSFFYL